MAYRSYEKRESVYLNIEEAELIKEALYSILGDDIDKRDMICALITEMNNCIAENKEHEAHREAYPATCDLEELLDEV